MIEHEKQKYIMDSEGNRIAVLSDIAVYEKIIGKPTTLNYTESCTDITRSASDIFGMLKHRKLSHPVSADEMNEAIRKRGRDDCTCRTGRKISS